MHKIVTCCLRIGFLAVVAVLAAGCMTMQTQRVYFAAADLNDNNPCPSLKFYRATIKAKAMNKKTHYQSGFYNANAVRELFSEVSFPTQGTPVSTTNPGAYSLAFDAKTGTWQVVGKDSLFTVFFGADANALATQVEAFAKADEDGLLLGRLMVAATVGDDYRAAQSAEDAAEEARARAATQAKLLEACVAKLDQGGNSKDVLLEALKGLTISLANAYGVSTAGATTDPAKLEALIATLQSLLAQQQPQAR